MIKLHPKYNKKDSLSFHKVIPTGLLFAQRPLRGILTVISFLIFNLVSLILISCSSSTPPDDTVTFSGTVTLEDTTDFSGVTVSLYKPVELDTALVRINQQYPNIGVQISQETEFDHREHQPLYSNLTDADGSWKIENVTKGEYNVVAEKDSFGWEYIINPQQYKVDNITLFKEKYLIGELTGELTFYANHHYVIKSNITLENNSSLYIEKGVWIKFDDKYTFDIYGNINIEEDGNEWVTFTSNKENPQEGNWRYIKVNNECTGNIKNCKIKYAENGIWILNPNNFIIRNLIIKNNLNTGVLLQQSENNTTIINCLIYNNNLGILSQYCMNNEIKNSIFYNNTEAIKLERSNINIDNNYYIKNEVSVYSTDRPCSKIIHNHFIDNKKGGYLHISDPEFNANNFINNNVAIYIQLSGYQMNSEPILKYNNFKENDYAIFIDNKAANPYYINNINAKYNYWNATAEFIIDQIIFDRMDVAIEDSSLVPKVIYKPFLYSNVDSAGVVK